MSEDQRRGQPATERRTILLVDDDTADRMQVRRLLSDLSDRYRVTEAASGSEGLEKCAGLRPDCVLLDYYLADMEGTVFLRRLREAQIAVPVAVLTGRDDQRLATEMLTLGAQDYLLKGTLTQNGLVRAIENAIEKFQIRRILEEKTTALELRTWQLETLREELQERLVELTDATRAKDQFMAVMSHELRTPLNAILGYADLLEMGIGGDVTDAQRRHLDRIRSGGRHLLDLINDILDLSRVETQSLELEIRPVDVQAALEEVGSLLRSQADAKGIDLVMEECPPDVPAVRADLRRLRQILLNLVGNAIKFTDEGEVRVRCDTTAQGMVRIVIRDTGIGIDPDVLPLIFDEFFQAQGKLTREKGGSGLGLAISQRLARAMDGDVVAESIPGTGSTFTLILPAADDATFDAIEAPRDSLDFVPDDEPTTEPRIVVVAFGDDAGSLTELERHVSEDVQLFWTTVPGEVPDLARRHVPDLVVLDVTAAGGAAWEIAHALQGVEQMRGTAVLLLPRIPTAGRDGTGIGFDLGWVSIVPKPFTAEQLNHAVSRAAGTNAPEGAERDVLVVDDDTDSRRVAAQFLADAGASVREAADGESALVAMRRHTPDVVVLDLMMPVLDGFGVVATMRADPQLAAVPVVVLSAKSLSDKERAFLARTAVRVLQKGEHRLADVAALVLRAAARRSAARPSPAGG